MANVVQVKFDGRVISAVPIGKAQGGWWMRSTDRVGRIAKGTRILVPESDIVSGELPAVKTMTNPENS